MENKELEKKLFKKNLEILYDMNKEILENLVIEIKRLNRQKIDKIDENTKTNLFFKKN